MLARAVTPEEDDYCNPTAVQSVLSFGDTRYDIAIYYVEGVTIDDYQDSHDDKTGDADH